MRECPGCGQVNAVDSRYCARCGNSLDVVIDQDRSAYATPVAPGTIFEGKYQVLEEIGRGGMGVVYKGQDLSLGRMVAIKVLPEQFNTDDEVIQRFKKEARAMASLDQSNIVPVYAIGQFRNFHYFVMKFLDGQTVADILEEMRRDGRERFEPRKVQQVMIDVCRGLGHAHSKGLIHRDIKPGNIMVGLDGSVTIMDFGIVKEQSGGEQLTRTGLVFGTPEYMAPEQAQGQGSPGPSTDLYSLGVVAYEMLSGVPPFRGNTPFSVVIKHIKEPPTPLIDVVPGVNRALQDVVFRCLEKRPDARWRNADLLREALLTVDPDVVDMDEDDPSFVVEEPTARRSSQPLPAPAPLPRNVPPPPAPSRAPPQPPPMAEINSLPPPGQIPGRAPPPRPDSPPSGPGRPLLPVAPPRALARPDEMALDPVLVDDRPGHYKLLTTGQKPPPNRPTKSNRALAVVVALVALTGVVLIAFALTRGPRVPEAPAPVPVAIPSGGAAAPPTQGAVDPVGLTDEVRVVIKTTPDRAEVVAADSGQTMGYTPHVLRRRKDTPGFGVSLHKAGFQPVTIPIKFDGDNSYEVTLTPMAPPSAGASQAGP